MASLSPPCSVVGDKSLHRTYISGEGSLFGDVLSVVCVAPRVGAVCDDSRQVEELIYVTIAI